MTASLLSAAPEILQRLSTANEIVLALDFDGTLAPIVERPELAAVPPGTMQVLRDLSASERLRVVILSGRSLADLQARIQADCILAGNHGLEIEGDGIRFLHEGAARARPAIDCICSDLREVLESITGVLVEDKGLSATVHYRQVPRDLWPWIEATVHGVMRPYAQWLVLKPARKAWEMRPRVEWDKGSALDLVLGHFRGEDQAVICAGDDATDEDMFRVRSGCISVQVGNRPSAARYSVDGPAGLALFLSYLAESPLCAMPLSARVG